jgi:mannan endo-1,4-beta-mannosidase
MLRFLSSRILFIIVFISYVPIASCQQKFEYPKPVNPGVSVQAGALLNFLYEIHGKYTLSGLHNGNCKVKSLTSENEEMKATVGKYPVIWGSDFTGAFKNINPDSARQNLIDTAKLMHKKGHIITLMWHCCQPDNGDLCEKDNIWVWDNSLSKAKWDSLTTPGTVLNNQWCKHVDIIAGYLKQLRDANIPVLWRPYHEMNGVWFWWCRHPGEEGFIKLWKMMYNYFTEHHKLNNLIWVWNANAPRDIPKDEAYAYKDYFPGVEYVDVLAADVYKNDWKQSHHDDLVKLGQGKLIALGEVGQLPTPDILERQPQWAWFMEWNTYFSKQNPPEVLKALFSDPRVITLDEISRTKEGYYKIN